MVYVLNIRKSMLEAVFQSGQTEDARITVNGIRKPKLSTQAQKTSAKCPFLWCVCELQSLQCNVAGVVWLIRANSRTAGHYSK